MRGGFSLNIIIQYYFRKYYKIGIWRDKKTLCIRDTKCYVIQMMWPFNEQEQKTSERN